MVLTIRRPRIRLVHGHRLVYQVQPHIADYFDTHPFVCGLTYSGYPLGCAAALATMQVYEEENLVENSRMMGKYLTDKLQEMKAKHPSVGDVRIIDVCGRRTRNLY